MNITYSVEKPPKVFNPCTVNLTFNTQEEFRMFLKVVGADDTVSTAISNKYLSVNRQKIKEMLSNIYCAISHLEN